ncbi:MAG: hypothetical protein SAL07_03055 [Oscillatoria sp. PMC 1051.18]|nr:hypothetical protein [Oscillatoria sp. PMC 1050.18]MEC5028867.1 hypothetical protein [Oscillatoria sp. PMC 1051.18]
MGMPKPLCPPSKARSQQPASLSLQSDCFYSEQAREYRHLPKLF